MVRQCETKLVILWLHSWGESVVCVALPSVKLKCWGCVCTSVQCPVHWEGSVFECCVLFAHVSCVPSPVCEQAISSISILDFISTLQ